MRHGRQYHRRARIPKVKRTIPIPAQGEEQDRYYKCWYCGFIVDKITSVLDDGKSGNASRHATLAAGVIPGDPYSAKIRVGTPIILRRVGLLGDVKPIYIERRSVVGSGCPSCGSHAWKD